MGQVKRHGVNFLVVWVGRASLDEIALEVGPALGVTFALSKERGLQDDYVATMAGLQVWLRIGDRAEGDHPQRILLVGVPEDELDADADWIDIREYIAELLAARTGRLWLTK